MKNITMFLWNNFTNDARVTREGSALVDAGYHVTVIAKREENERELEKREQLPSGIQVYRKDKAEISVKALKASTLMKKHIPNALLMFKMIAAGYKIDTDVYHSHDLNTLIQGVVCAKLRPRKRTLVFDSHEVNTSRTNYSAGLVYKVEKFLLNFVDHTIVENETRATYHERLYGDRPMSLHNYSEYYDISEVPAAELAIPADKKILLYQGGLQQGRGLPLLIDAFKEADVDAVLLMVGDGKIRQQLEEQVRTLGISDKVIFTGRVPYELLRAYTKRAYIGFQILQNTNFNHYSASSNKLYEYMMAHVPVIGTNMPEIRRVIEAENIGLVISESDKNELTAAIRYVMTHPEKHAEWVLNNEHAKDIYNWEQEKAKLLNLYKTINVGENNGE
ncbi:glycosyltransferase family 4 protein [Macrococcus equipercicus]|uniref:Glycosyltransferase family 4 protein n=1 Tax=Macrococcus equipercicus TaxID=69967 RepID=A0ABQ6RBQ4_9STAP|nr:glycosyltransferase family 4 protein [Macrococcus equipercicus]KAA1042631.1 glycosyltransferase family 4 protein [Macrococcus equipercicus]